MNYTIELSNSGQYTDEYVSNIRKTTDLIVSYVEKRLLEIENLDIKNAKNLIGMIFDELPVTKVRFSDGKLIIIYSKNVNIIIDDPLLKILRDLKIEQILKR